MYIRNTAGKFDLLAVLVLRDSPGQILLRGQIRPVDGVRVQAISFWTPLRDRPSNRPDFIVLSINSVNMLRLESDFPAAVSGCSLPEILMLSDFLNKL